MPKRRDLKPAKPVSDARFLAAAQANATKAANRAARQRRIEENLKPPRPPSSVDASKPSRDR